LILLLLVRRALISVVILFFVSALLFCILRMLPVDPAAMSLPPMATIAEIEAKRREMGLDLPLPEQFMIWLGEVLHGDFGTSIHFRRSVVSLVGSTLPSPI
jgi:ABC-type dipeptide/oligopeptide/nickel transport system permease component